MLPFPAGKDIFELDKLFFVVNQDNVHWGLAVIFMQLKRIQFYDSLGVSGRQYLTALLAYLQQEHEHKRNCPLPDPDSWELIQCTDDTPRQTNGTIIAAIFCSVHLNLTHYVSSTPLGFDCGVFTCMYAYCLSTNLPVVAFAQDDMGNCRDRIAISIIKNFK